MTNDEYSQLAAKAAGVAIGSNGKPAFTSYEQSMKYAEALTNLHKSGIDRNSTPQEIAAASVGTTVNKNGAPNISSLSQGQGYGSALKNITSNTYTSGTKPNTVTPGTNGLKTYTATVNSVDAKASPSNKRPSSNGSLSIALTGEYLPLLESQLKNIENSCGTKYISDNVFKGDTSIYDPVERAKQNGLKYIYKSANGITIPATNIGGRGYTYTKHSYNIPVEQDFFLQEICHDAEVDYYLAAAIIAHESGSDPNASNEKGYAGYMAFKDDSNKYTGSYFDYYTGQDSHNPNGTITNFVSDNYSAKNWINKARDLGADTRNVKDPYTNIVAGVSTLKDNMNNNNNDIASALGGYSGGGSDGPSTKEIMFYANYIKNSLGIN